MAYGTPDKIVVACPFCGGPVLSLQTSSYRSTRTVSNGGNKGKSSKNVAGYFDYIEDCKTCKKTDKEMRDYWKK